MRVLSGVIVAVLCVAALKVCLTPSGPSVSVVISNAVAERTLIVDISNIVARTTVTKELPPAKSAEVTLPAGEVYLRAFLSREWTKEDFANPAKAALGTEGIVEFAVAVTNKQTWVYKRVHQVTRTGPTTASAGWTLQREVEATP